MATLSTTYYHEGSKYWACTEHIGIMLYDTHTNHDTSLVYVEHAIIIIGYQVHAVLVLVCCCRSVLQSYYVYAGVLHVNRFLEQHLVVRQALYL